MRIFSAVFIVVVTSISVHSSEQETLEEDISDIRKSINEKKPDEAQYKLARLGILLLKKGSEVLDAGWKLRLEALHSFERALSVTSVTDVARLTIHLLAGTTYSDIGMREMANKQFELAGQSSDGASEQALVSYYHGKSENNFGFHDNAVNLLERSLKLSPSFQAAYLPLVQSHIALEKFQENDWRDLLKKISKKLEKKETVHIEIDREAQEISVSKEDPLKPKNSDVYWALYLIADQLGETKLAWDHLQQAHEILSKTVDPYEKDKISSQTTSIQSVFKEGFWPEPSSKIGSSSGVPIFLVGMQRSGASLLEAMLAAHPHIYGTGDASITSVFSFEMRSVLIQELGKPKHQQNLQGMAKDISSKILNSMKELMRNDTSISESKRSQSRFIVDKTLSSFRTLGVLQYIFPKALIININRDPMDNILSCYTNNILDKESTWSLDQADLAHEYLQYLQIIDHYRKSLPNGLVDVSYEELVTNPKRALEPVLERLGLAWHPSMLQFHKTPRNVPLRARSQLSKGLSDESIGRWSQYSYQLLPTIIYLKKVLPIARDKNLVFYPDKMNWDIDEDFEYPEIDDVDEGEDTVTGNEEDLKGKGTQSVDANARKVKEAKDTTTGGTSDNKRKYQTPNPSVEVAKKRKLIKKKKDDLKKKKKRSDVTTESKKKREKAKRNNSEKNNKKKTVLKRKTKSRK